MVDVEKATQLALRSFRYNSGAFYGPAANLSLGFGLIYDKVRFPLLDITTKLYDLVEGPAYVLTHECDVDSANERHFNDFVLICPIILFEAFADGFAESYSEDAFYGILPDIAADRIFRVFYFPPFQDALRWGGLIYLNRICSTHVDEFSDGKARPLCALSEYAQQILDFKLRNHLFRPKVEHLPRLT